MQPKDYGKQCSKLTGLQNQDSANAMGKREEPNVSASERRDASLTSLRFAYSIRPLAAIALKSLPSTGCDHLLSTEIVLPVDVPMNKV